MLSAKEYNLFGSFKENCSIKYISYGIDLLENYRSLRNGNRTDTKSNIIEKKLS